MIGPPSDPPNWFFSPPGKGFVAVMLERGCVKGSRREVCVALAVVESRAVEAVGSGLGLGCDDRRDRLAELGVEVLRGDLRLRERVRIWVDDDNSENRILIIGSIKLEGDAGKGLSVDFDLLRPLRIFAGSVAPTQAAARRAKEVAGW